MRRTHFTRFNIIWLNVFSKNWRFINLWWLFPYNKLWSILRPNTIWLWRKFTIFKALNVVSNYYLFNTFTRSNNLMGNMIHSVLNMKIKILCNFSKFSNKSWLIVSNATDFIVGLISIHLSLIFRLLNNNARRGLFKRILFLLSNIIINFRSRFLFYWWSIALDACILFIALFRFIYLLKYYKFYWLSFCRNCVFNSRNNRESCLRLLLGFRWARFFLLCSSCLCWSSTARWGWSTSE